MEHFFKYWSALRCTPESKVKLLEGMQMKTILKLLGGIPSNYWGDISPHPPLFRHHWCNDTEICSANSLHAFDIMQRVKWKIRLSENLTVAIKHVLVIECHCGHITWATFHPGYWPSLNHKCLQFVCFCLVGCSERQTSRLQVLGRLAEALRISGLSNTRGDFSAQKQRRRNHWTGHEAK